MSIEGPNHDATGAARLPSPEPATVAQRILYRAVRFVLLGFARLWFRLRVEGGERVPAEGPFILSPVHRSNIDFLVVLAVSRRRMRYLAKDTLWKPVTAGLFNALGGIPVARGSADREALRTCVAVIEQGEPLVIFPEGTRQSGPEVCAMFDGPAFVQARTGAPIVPVGIGGSEAAMPRGKRMIRPRRIRIVVGEPLPALSVEGARARRSAIRDQTERLGDEIQVLFDEAQRQAGTPNRRAVAS